MTGNYVQRGENLDYVNPTDEVIEAGTVVAFGTRAAVAANRIAPHDTGTITTTGVFEFTKDSSEIAAGAAVYYDDTDDTSTAAVTDVVMGYAIADASADASSVRVKLLG